MKKLKPIILLILITTSLFSFVGNNTKVSALNNTYFVALNGNDSNLGTSAAPWATLSYAFGAMTGGDTLIIKNGTYVGQTVKNVPSGTASNYTIVKAENDWGVTIDATTLGQWDSSLNIQGSSFIQVEGIRFKGGKSDGTVTGAAFIGDSKHIKIKKCAFFDTGTRSPDSIANISTLATDQSHHVLFEDCYAWGAGRYKANIHESDKVILRRFVARHDRMEARYPQALFAIYRSSNTQLQNVIAIDSDQRRFYTGYSGFYGAIYSPNSDTTYSNTGLKILGSIVLNVDGESVDVPFTLGEHVIKDSVFWHNKSGIGYSYPTNASVTIDHTTIGDIYGQRVGDIEPNSGVGVSGFGAGITVRNSAIYKNNLKGLWNVGASDYNDFYENSENYGSGWLNGTYQTPTSQGSHDRFVNPGFRHITQIESNSPLKNAANDGGDIGANILKRYGVSGTLWGDPGFEDLTNENLWPWPYENQISADMRSFTEPSGNRGFATARTTLTRYIWEYLGSSCPVEICNSQNTNPEPNPPAPPPSPPASGGQQPPPLPPPPPPPAPILLHPNGTLIKIAGSSSVYIVDNGRKRFVSPPVFSARGFRQNIVITVAAAEMNSYPLGTALAFRDSALVRERNSFQVYIFENDQKLPISADTLNRYGFNRPYFITIVPAGALSPFQTGPPLVP